ncbi:MAG: hypothetical protein H6740_07365 [Alphaproteobacteria bacterium]|nr:hypothetical protein [Alphaproteobacteria bacterium]
MALATVLYEDKLGPSGAFGPHLFLLACLGDRLDMDHWGLRDAFEDVQRNGIGPLIRDLRERRELLRHDGRALVALLDGDRVHEHLKDRAGSALARGASDAQIEAALFPEGTPEGVAVFILRDNTESLLRAVAACGDRHGLPVVPARLARKSRSERDSILLRAANASNRALRDCVLEQMPSLLQMVRHLELLVAS